MIIKTDHLTPNPSYLNWLPTKYRRISWHANHTISYHQFVWPFPNLWNLLSIKGYLEEIMLWGKKHLAQVLWNIGMKYQMIWGQVKQLTTSNLHEESRKLILLYWSLNINNCDWQSEYFNLLIIYLFRALAMLLTTHFINIKLLLLHLTIIIIIIIIITIQNCVSGYMPKHIAVIIYNLLTWITSQISIPLNKCINKQF